MDPKLRKVIWFVGFVALVASTSCISKQKQNENREPAHVPTTEDGIASFRYVHAIAVSPRCANCHVQGDRPMQFDGAERRFHSMNIQRQISKLGHSCQTCHQEHNGDLAHMPPGAHNWSLPDRKKGYDSMISPAALCRLYKNPASNFFESGPKKGMGRTPHDLLEHVSTDPLIIWAWTPGPGRVPAPGVHHVPENDPGAYSWDDISFVSHFKRWVDTGAPCPAQ